MERFPLIGRFSLAVTSVLHHRRNRRVVVSAGVGIFQRLVQVGSTLVLMPLLLRVLGPATFGVWGAAASLAWLSGLVDIGTGLPWLRWWLVRVRLKAQSKLGVT